MKYCKALRKVNPIPFIYKRILIHLCQKTFENIVVNGKTAYYEQFPLPSKSFQLYSIQCNCNFIYKDFPFLARLLKKRELLSWPWRRPAWLSGGVGGRVVVQLGFFVQLSFFSVFYQSSVCAVRGALVCLNCFVFCRCVFCPKLLTPSDMKTFLSTCYMFTGRML